MKITKEKIISFVVLACLLLFSTTSHGFSTESAGSNHLIFGYGCLINSELREKSESMKSVAIPARISEKFGYRRVWNFQGPSYCALGLEESTPGESINGVVYLVDVDNIEVWDQFEKGYHRVEIPRDNIEFLSWLKPKESLKIWIYIPNSDLQSVPDKKTPLMQSYLDTVLSGCMEHGRDFAIEFLESTYGWPSWWLDDRVYVKDSWASRRNQKFIDQLLLSYPSAPHRNKFAKRKDHAHYSSDMNNDI